jgi:hypothetical protein
MFADSVLDGHGGASEPGAALAAQVAGADAREDRQDGVPEEAVAERGRSRGRQSAVTMK